MDNNEHSLNHILYKAGIEIYICDAETFKYLYANETASNNIGYSMEELRSLTPIVTSPEFSMESMKELLLPLHGDDPPREVITNSFIFRKSGSIYPADIHLQKTEYAGRSAYVAFVVDATEKKHAQNQLRLVIEGSSLGYWDWNHHDGTLFVDDQWLELTGLTLEEVENNPEYWHKYIHPDDRVSLHAAVVGALENDIPYVKEFRMTRKDGTTIWLQSAGSVVSRDLDTGKALRMCGTHRDITERKKGELEREEFFKFFQMSSDLMVIGDLNGNFYKANPATLSTFGYTEEELLSMAVVDLVFEEDQERTKKEHSNQIETGKSLNFENRCVCKDGSLRWLSWRASYDSETGFSYASARDITLQKEVEEELQKMQKLTSLGVLAGGIAHDFNNILTILFGNISLAKSQLSADHISFDTLERAEQAFHRATHLTSQLLTFAKGGDPIKQDVCISEVVRETINFDLSGSNVKLILSADKGLWMAQADKGQISQVFSNLAINADQAMPEGGRLDITLRNTEVDENEVIGLSSGRYIKFSVVDEGVGIQVDQLGKIFDPYYTTKQAGSGLGLATVYSIISKHGGTITVSSRPGKGTSFQIYLPASDIQVVEEKTSSGEDETTDKKIMKILIMDDEEMICNLAQAILKGDGYLVESAGNGEKTVELYRSSLDHKEPFDCIIMDLTIPGGMGGEEAIVKILELNPDAKVIVSSGYAADPVMANFSKYGFKGVITKPFTIQSIRDEVARLLNS